MNILVTESSHHGHFYNYLRHLLPALLDVSPRVTLALTAAGRASTEFQAHLAPFESRLQMDLTLNTPSVASFSNAWARARDFETLLRRHRPDHVFIPSADGLAQLCGLRHALGRGRPPQTTTVEAALHRGSFAYPAATPRAKAAALFSRRTLDHLRWRRLLHVDVLAAQWIGQHDPRLAAKSEVLPDPIEPAPPIATLNARKEFNLPPDAFIIGCVGTMTSRKGIDLLIRAFVRAAPQAPGVHLFLLGVFDPNVRETLHTEGRPLLESGRIIALDQYATNAQFDTALAAMDAVCTPYPAHVGIASILLRAVAAGKPLLSADHGWSGFITRQLRLGTTVNVTNAEAFTAAILDAPARFAHYTPPPAAARLLQFHSVQNFQNTWTALLRKRLGLPPRRIVVWDEVINC